MTWMFLSFVALMVVMCILVVFCVQESTEPRTKTYELRFEPSNNKYYIVYINRTGKEERVLGRWGIRTIYYENMIDANYVLEKLNLVKDSSTEKPQDPKELK